MTTELTTAILCRINLQFFMSGLTNSHNQAIFAARTGNWQDAIGFNLKIIKQNERDTAALNRLGVAYLQIKESKKAVEAFRQVLEVDKNNQIAKKNLKKAQSTDLYVPPSFSQPHFIEEPGKTRVIELHRLADKGCLNSFAAGTLCTLRCKKRYISVEANGKYIGALPEDISFRLSRLIEKGNQYLCYLHTTSHKNCSVYLKEVFRSQKNQDVTSFPVSRTNSEGDGIESVLIEDDIPVEVIDHDKEEEEEERGRNLDFE